MPSANDALADAQDVFDNLAVNRTNVLDLAAHYPYSQERWRLSVDGSRVFPEYESSINDLAQYTHATDTHDLSPASGETVTLESAERPRYVVQYELAATWAFAVNQSLSGDDAIQIGLYDGQDGWYLEHRGDHADDTTADLVGERAGSEIYREPDVDIQRSVQAFARLKLKTGWYRVTRQAWERSYSEDGKQRNVTIGGAGVSADDAEGPRTGNLPIHFSVTADASTSGLVLSAGSAAQVNLGTTVPLTRTKAATFDDTTTATGTWEPIRAFRVDPDRAIVNTQLTDLQALSYSADTTVNLAVVTFADENVTFGGGDSWGTPAIWSTTNNVIETRADISGIVDSSGASATTATNPGGYQLGKAVLTPTGQQFQKGATSSGLAAKRNLPRDDIAVVLANVGSVGDVTYETTWEQDW